MSDKNMLTLEIDGQSVTAEAGKYLIEVADEVGIPIPRFCYHKKLSIAANCRMCLVDVEKMPKPMPACATPISEGMIVRTRSSKARDAQKSVMEFLLINHPLDCPICDQGGECELQDFAVEYGDDHSSFNEEKRHLAKNDIGPLVETYMNRCIQCTRCIRYGEEVAGLRELGGIDRGDRLEISTYINKSLSSEVSANIIDICPVGALTDKPSKFQGRPWEYRNNPSLSIHDGLGTNTMIHTLRGKIARVVSRENESINETWIADRDRFSHEAIYSNDRIQTPFIKNEELQVASWENALKATQLVIQGAIEKYSSDAIDVFVSPSTTIEEQYLLKKTMDHLSIKNIEGRFNQIDFSDDHNEPRFRGLGLEIKQIPALDSIFLVGADPRMEAPILGIKIRQAVKNGAKVSLLNSYNTDQLHDLNVPLIAAPQDWLGIVSGLITKIATQKKVTLASDIGEIVKSNTDLVMDVDPLAQQLMTGKKQWILLGKDVVSHPKFGMIRALLKTLTTLLDCSLGYLSDGANSTGLYLNGLTKAQIKDSHNSESTKKKTKLVILVGAIDIEDMLQQSQFEKKLAQAEAVILISPFMSDSLRKYITIALPASPWGETDGSFMNIEGYLQSAKTAMLPQFESKPLWKIMRVLGNHLDVPNFEFVDTDEILTASGLNQQEPYDNLLHNAPVEISEDIPYSEFLAVPSQSVYSSDAYVRRARSLQLTPLAAKKRITVNSKYKELLKNSIRIGGIEFIVRSTDKMAENSIRIPREYGASVNFYELIKG